MDPMGDYYQWDYWRKLLGLGNNAPYQPPQMQYLGQKEQEKKQQGGSSNNQMLQQMLNSMGTTQTGMTPNATNQYGESYYGWGAKTGDWGSYSGAPTYSSEAGMQTGADLGYGAAPSSVGAGTSAGAYSDIGGELAATYGGGSGAAGSSSALSYANPLGYILGGLAVLHQFNAMTDRNYQGEATKDIFGGNFTTDPWVPLVYQKLGIDKPSAGEEFDAAMQNGDWNEMAQKLPASIEYWFNPFGNMGYDMAQSTLGNKAADMIFPEQWMLGKFGKLFSRLF